MKQQLNVIRDKKERLHAAMKTVSCAEQVNGNRVQIDLKLLARQGTDETIVRGL